MGRTDITCKDFSGMIPAFLGGVLEDRDLSRFLEHYELCADCREELEIQYLVGKAFDRMEVGEEINLSRDIPAFVEEQRRQMAARARLGTAAFIAEWITIMAAFATVVLYMR